MFSLETCPPFNLSNGNVSYSRMSRDGRYSPGTKIIRPSCNEGFAIHNEIPGYVPVCDAQGNWTEPFIRCIGDRIRLFYFRGLCSAVRSQNH